MTDYQAVQALFVVLVSLVAAFVLIGLLMSAGPPFRSLLRHCDDLFIAALIWWGSNRRGRR